MRQIQYSIYTHFDVLKKDSKMGRPSKTMTHTRERHGDIGMSEEVDRIKIRTMDRGEAGERERVHTE